MAYAGFLEAQIVIATAIDQDFVDNAGTRSITIPADAYWNDEFATLLTTLIAAEGGDWTFDFTMGEPGTANVGHWEIDAPNDHPFSITWGAGNVLRDLLGYAANIAGANALQVAPNIGQSFWCPNVDKTTKHGDEYRGRPVTDLRQTINARGRVKTLGGRLYYVHEGIVWDGVTDARALTHFESTDNESFETWWTNTQAGAGAPGAFDTGSAVRLYWNGAVDSSYVEGRLRGLGTFDPSQLVPGWTGRYRIELPTLVVES